MYAVPIKILVRFFVGIGKIIVQFKWKGKGSGVDKTILNKNNKVGGIGLPHFKV